MAMRGEVGTGTLADRVIVVTGASSGVGYAVARRLALVEGAKVVAVGRRRMFRIEALARQVADLAGRPNLLAITADMAAPGQAQSVAVQTLEHFGRVDGFLHGVNRALRLMALEVNDQEFDMTLQVNVKSALYGVQALSPTLRAQHAGGIVIYNPTPDTTPEFSASEAVYAAAAQALAALADGWRRQLAPHRVRVREIAPRPLTDPATGDSSAHADLAMEALRETLLAPSVEEAPAADLRRAWSPEAVRPVVLSRRGGLALTQFSQA